MLSDDHDDHPEEMSSRGTLLEGQFRIELVQVLNWGGYGGLHQMRVGRNGTAILGPTGMGKSTILDAMAAVIMPNPQEFNRAARDDGGKKAERTVYSYARGKIDDVKDKVDAESTATTTKFRRPIGEAFPSGAAITWSTDLGERVTAVRIAWITPDTATQDEVNSTTMYMLVHGAFSLQRLGEVEEAARSRSPLNESALKSLVDQSRDLVTASQPTLRTRLCDKLGIGDSEESQLLALQLLRQAQASKGVFSINDVFKKFVLTEPLALSRWKTTLSAYREASSLYDVFEDARKRLSILKDIPKHAERYESAIAGSDAKRRLYTETDDRGRTRLGVWHAERVRDWIEAETEQNRISRATADQQRQSARSKAAAAEAAWNSLAAQVTLLGGDRTKLIKAELKAAQEAHDRVARDRAAFEKQLSSVSLDLPHSAEDMGVLRELIRQQQDEIRGASGNDKPQAQELGQRVVNLKNEIARLEDDITSYRRRQSKVPRDADERRAWIAEQTGTPAEHLRYVGELVDVASQHRDWSTAVNRVLGGVATHLIVEESSFVSVRRFVNDHDMHSQVILVPAQAGLAPTKQLIPGTVPDMLAYDENSPFYGWLHDELVEDQSILCVQTADELDNLPTGVKGAVTRAGLRTGSRGRFIKDDRRRQSWLGLDNTALIAELNATLETKNRELGQARHDYDQHDAGVKDRDRQLATLAEAAQIEWSSIDLEPTRRQISSHKEALREYEVHEPKIAELSNQMGTYDEARAIAQNREQHFLGQIKTLDLAWGALSTAIDGAKDRIAEAAPLTDEDRSQLAKLPFAAPHSWDDGETEDAVERALVRAINVSLDQATADLRQQVDQHRRDADVAEELLVKTFEQYRDADESAEIDATIASLPAVQAIHRALVEDDLPRARANWISKAGATMTESLRSLLVQIDSDARSIQKGIRPINEVLEGIEFREGSSLQIDPHPRGNSDLREFKKTLTRHTQGTLGVERDEATIERQFLALKRDLARLDEKTRSGDSWRHRVLDAREHVLFRAIETPQEGPAIVHEGVSGLSGGEGQELIAFVLGAALRYRLGAGSDRPPTYAPIVLDEGFVKADSEYTGRALAALRSLGFQLIIGAPRDKVAAFENFVDTVAYIGRDTTANKTAAARIYSLTIEEAVEMNRLGIELGETA